MTRPELSVIIPSAGRDSIISTLHSIRSQADAATVEIVVVLDTALALPRSIAAALRQWCEDAAARLYEHDAGFSHWGHPQCQYGMQRATGESLAFLGDDDLYLPGALAALRAVTAPVMLFRAEMLKLGGAVVWDEARLAENHISGQCIVARNSPRQLGCWGTGPNRSGDYDFIRSTLGYYRESDIDWREEVIARCL